MIPTSFVISKGYFVLTIPYFLQDHKLLNSTTDVQLTLI